MNSDPGSNFIRRLETHSGNVLRQTIRILLHNAVKTRFIRFIYFNRKRIADPKSCQIYHRFPYILFFFHLSRNFPCNSFAYPFNRTGAQISFHTFFILRRRNLKGMYLELFPVNGMRHIFSLDTYSLSLPQILQYSYTGNFFSLADKI